MRTRTAQWFETTVRYERTSDDGTVKKVNELYVTEVLSFAEAESQITKEIEPFVTGDFDVVKIAIAPYGEVFFTDSSSDDKFYKARLSFITLDEKSAKEKKTAVVFLVQASSVEAARKNIDDVMHRSAMDYVINSITETKILDVFEHAKQ